jgi:hypothetical protein
MSQKQKWKFGQIAGLCTQRKGHVGHSKKAAIGAGEVAQELKQV